ncbi:MAG: RMD1 family protein [Nanoarchaeota archaeon]|nr:RMD1 family protein [Nanoarchaeota archaeon]MBU4456723.1 RMD1 family protein [Nanoarchaeota archaeon]MCG2720061.1 RMD1 family protein [Nanoarchaeota archaeon]
MEKYNLNAVYIASKLPLNLLENIRQYKLIHKEKKRLIFQFGKNKFFFLNSFGVIVFFNMNHSEIGDIIEFLKEKEIKIVKEKVREAYEEDFVIIKSNKEIVEFKKVYLRKVSLDSIMILTWIISRSVALDNYEVQVDNMMEKFSKLNYQLKTNGKLKIKSKELLKIIGANNSIIEGMISKLSLLEKPAITWEKENLDWLFNSLYELFEIKERFDTVEYKLNFIQNNSNILLESIRSKNEVILDMTIIILIFIAVILFAYDLWPHFFS